MNYPLSLNFQDASVACLDTSTPYIKRVRPRIDNFWESLSFQDREDIKETIGFRSWYDLDTMSKLSVIKEVRDYTAPEIKPRATEAPTITSEPKLPKSREDALRKEHDAPAQFLPFSCPYGGKEDVVREIREGSKLYRRCTVAQAIHNDAWTGIKWLHEDKLRGAGCPQSHGVGLIRGMFSGKCRLVDGERHEIEV